MRIGELARRAGVSPGTIRYYEHVGLLPQPPRTEGGYRTYGEQDLAGLRFIRAAQSVSLCLGEIREVLNVRDRGQAPCAHVVGLLEGHAEAIAEQIVALRQMRRDLLRLARRARSAQSQDAGAAQYCHIIERGSRAS